jgi:hypothetical protein
MTTRRWILVLATVALLLSDGRLAERRTFFLGRAEADASRADDLINGRMCFEEDYSVSGYSERLADYWLTLARKYERAATRPWLCVPHDLPPPKP